MLTQGTQIHHTYTYTNSSCVQGLICLVGSDQFGLLSLLGIFSLGIFTTSYLWGHYFYIVSKHKNKAMTRQC